MYPTLILLCALLSSAVSTRTKPDPRIINGDPASKGQFPWQVSLEITKFGSPTWCGGALISDRWVLTAGHCVDGAEHILVRLGSVKLTENDPDREVVPTVQYIQHEGYNSQLNNDVAVVFLPRAVHLNDNIKVVPLASTRIPSGTTVTVSGWGLTSDNEDKPSQVLNYVNLTIIPDSDCRPAFDNQLPTGAFCAQSKGSLVQATCEGDSGGPVVSGNVHVGVVSFGSSDGCESGKPVAFARTDLYREWIRDKTGI